MDNQQNVLLDVEKLHTGYRLQGEFYDAADGISFTLKRNEVLAIVGESGCGKSTIASSIVGLYDRKNTRVEGEIRYKNLNLVNLSEDLFNQVRGNNIGMIFQDPMASLNPLMKVGDQVAEALLYHTDMNKQQRRDRVIELFNQVGMPKPEAMYDMYPHELSGGLRQRVVIAMAVACKPEIIIADEPTTALDVTIQAQILDLLKKIQKESDSGIILITHDLGVVVETADEVAVMYAGQIVEKADVKTLFTHLLHPYTRSLLNSIPQSDDDKDELHVIQGTVPSLKNMPRTGDRFAARIPWIPAEAHEADPQLHEVEPNHFVRCTCWKTFHFQDEG